MSVGNNVFLGAARKSISVELFALITTAIFLCFWHLGLDTINRWDEARFGYYAREMLLRQDFINYYFDGVAQPWTAKPPLAIWLIALAYKLFGFNEFSLRFFSALSGVLSFLILFRVVSLYRPVRDCLWICLIAMTCKGIIGDHVSRTGDVDAVLLLFLMGQLYGFLLFVDFEKSRGLIYFGLALGLAFYAKGSAAIFYLPGLFLYAGLRHRLQEIAGNRYFWMGLAVFGLFPLSWYLLVKLYGNTFDSATFGGSNAWQNLFLYDAWSRFTQNIEGQGGKGPFFVFGALERKLTPWVWLLVVQVVWLMWRTRRLSRPLNSQRIGEFKPSLETVSCCIAGTLILILTVSASKLSWYVAPIVPAAAIFIYRTQLELELTNGWFKSVFLVLFAFALGKTVLRLDQPKLNEISKMLRENRLIINRGARIVVSPNLPQDYRLYLSWYNRNVINARQEVGATDRLSQEFQIVIESEVSGITNRRLQTAEFEGERVRLTTYGLANE